MFSKSDAYYKKNKLCKLNALYTKKNSYTLKPFLFAILIASVKKLKLNFFKCFE